MEPQIFDYAKSEVFHGFTQSTEVCTGEYKGIRITETYRNPRHWGKQPSTTYLVDLIFPMGMFNCLDDRYYTPEGYGMPVFNNVEAAKEFINQYKQQ